MLDGTLKSYYLASDNNRKTLFKLQLYISVIVWIPKAKKGLVIMSKVYMLAAG